jgi:phosphate-selective porin OprO/OprP
MNFNKKLAVAVSGAVLLMAGQFALADSATDIVDALVSKGVLTEEEGKLITKGHKSKTDITPVVKTKDNALSLETADGKSSIQVNGRVHFDYRTFDYPANNTSATAVPAGSDTFDMRRARIGVKGQFAKYYTGEIVINTVGNGANDIVDVAYIDVAWFQKAKLRFGQFKMPFSLEQLTSSNNIDFIERSFVDSQIPAKERGAQVFGEPMDGMTYALAVGTGIKAAENTTAGARELDNAHADLDFIGRATINFAEIVKNKDMVAHVGLAFQAGDQYRTTDAMGGSQKARSRSDVTFFTMNSSALGNTYSNQLDRQRIGLEGALASGPFKIQGQYVDGKFDFQTGSSGVGVDQRPSIETGYIQALWTLTGETHASRYKAGAFGSFKPTKNFDPDTMTGGAWEIGARYGFFDASDYRNVTGAQSNGFFKANDMTLGIKFVANPNFRIMADYMKTSFKDQIGTGVTVGGHANQTDEKAIIVRTQVMF